MSRLGEFWGRNFTWLEGIVAVVVAGSFGAWIHFDHSASAQVNDVMAGNRAAVYGALAAIFGSLLGFAITALSIAMASSQDPRMKMVRDSKYYGTMWKVFTKNISGLSLGTVGALAGLIVDRDRSPAPLVMVIVAWTTALATLRTGRCIWLLEKLVEVIKGGAGKQAAT